MGDEEFLAELEQIPAVRDGEFRHIWGTADTLYKSEAIDSFGQKYLLGIYETKEEAKSLRGVERGVRAGPQGHEVGDGAVEQAGERQARGRGGQCTDPEDSRGGEALRRVRPRKYFKRQ